MRRPAAARWPFLVFGAVVCLTGACVGAALGWLGAALYQLDLAGPNVSRGNLAGMLWGAPAGGGAALLWWAAMMGLAWRALRRPYRPFSSGRMIFLGLVLGCLAGALGTAALHCGLSFELFRSRAEPALWFLGLLIGVPAGGMGGLAGGLACALLVRVSCPAPPETHVDLAV